MPETGIGFFPDVGGSAFLPHLHDNFGYYLALTGNRIRWGDCLQSGIATHAVAASDLDDLRDDLVAKADLDGALASAQYPDFETAPKPAKSLRKVSHMRRLPNASTLWKSSSHGQ